MVNVHNIGFAIDDLGVIYTVFPIWTGDSLVKLTHKETGVSFKVLKGDLFEFYTLLDHDENIIHQPDTDLDEWILTQG